ncbi:MAG: hypothetical protein ACMUIM_10215 [bacterium]
MEIWKRKGMIITIAISVLLLIPLIREGMHLSQHKNGIPGEKVYKGTGDFIFPYTLSQPAKKFKLPHRLDEISGLSYFKQNRLICIQDEIGAMYEFDIEKGKVTEDIKFGEGRDCEDIEIVEKIAYILQSNGTILQIKDFENGPPKVRKINTKLSRKNDTEGLAFDEESNALLIACKGSPYLKKKCKELKGKKAVYRFDLDTEEIFEEPACIIDMKSLKDPGGDLLTTKSFIGLFKIFNQVEEDIDFRPSGIAVHPKTKNIYIISSVDRMLIVCNRKGEMIAAEELSKKAFRQPEGICFNPEGDLFISNERKGKRANILMFKYNQKGS